jgi:hypothetical protein
MSPATDHADPTTTEASAPAGPAPETPTDDVEAPAAVVKKPTAANRYQLFDDGQGDYRIYEISQSKELPKGTLLPIAEVPGFESSAAARKFINNSGDLLEGKQLMILKGLEICAVDVQTVKKVDVKFKPKRAITGPASSTGEDGK